MADLKVALDDLAEEAESPALLRPGFAVGAPHGCVAGRLRRSRSQQLERSPVSCGGSDADRIGDRTHGPFLTRLTSDVGWTDYPAISLDGKFLAYASDRSGDGNLDIWVQQLPDGAPVRVTDDTADDVDPSFSADGSRIAFQSSRPRRRDLHRPDARWRRAAGRGARVFAAVLTRRKVDCLRRGRSRRRSDLRRAGRRWPGDARRGRLLSRHSPQSGRRTGGICLFWGQRERGAAAEHNIDWYVAAVPGGSAAPVMRARCCCERDFRRSRACRFPMRGSAAGTASSFMARSATPANMWQVGDFACAGGSAERRSARRSARRTKQPPR